MSFRFLLERYSKALYRARTSNRTTKLWLEESVLNKRKESNVDTPVLHCTIQSQEQPQLRCGLYKWRHWTNEGKRDRNNNTAATRNFRYDVASLCWRLPINALGIVILSHCRFRISRPESERSMASTTEIMSVFTVKRKSVKQQRSCKTAPPM